MKYIFVFLLVLFSVVPSVYAAPASLSFDPINIQTTSGKPIDVTINIFTGNQPVASTDIWLSYDPTILQPLPDNTKTGSLFKTVDVKEIEPGKLYIYGIADNPREVTPVQGTIATIQFMSLKAGTSQLRYECDSSMRSSSQIIAVDNNLTNVISCPATISHSSTVTVTENNILGVSTENNLINQLSYILGIIVIIFSIVLFVRYQRIRHEIS